MGDNERLDDKFEELERGRFVSECLVGPCPRCEGDNTHDCEPPETVPGVPDFGIQPFIMGSECEAAKVINDNTVGHCDACGALWCLGCGRVFTTERKPLNELRNLVEAHFPYCGENIEEIYLPILDDTILNGIDIECSICQRKVSEGYSIDARNPSHYDAVVALLGDEPADWLICFECIDEFKDRLQKRFKSRIKFRLL